jgi:hypothetical protein
MVGRHVLFPRGTAATNGKAISAGGLLGTVGFLVSMVATCIFLLANAGFTAASFSTSKKAKPPLPRSNEQAGRATGLKPSPGAEEGSM